MGFTDTAFLFLFLPTVLFFYYLGWKPLRPYLLLVASLFFYACGAKEYFILLVISLCINIAAGWSIADLLASSSRGKAKLILAAGIFYNVGILVNYKYMDFIGENVCRLFAVQYEKHGGALPLGLSFFTFKATSYLADIYREKIRPGMNPIYPALYLSFFPQLPSGPLARYDTMAVHSAQNCKKGGIHGSGKASEAVGTDDLRSGFGEAGTLEPENGCSWDRFSSGVTRFIIGFSKKILLADTLCGIADAVYASDLSVLSSGYAWLGAVCYSLQLYYDFSGYSDMAVGLSRMFGYDCPENFHYPYMTKSVSEFWRRWHITLGSWFRDYIYIPLGGSRVKSRRRLYRNLLVVWLLTGLWHGANWTFIVWGLSYFLLIAFEKTTGLPQRLTNKALAGIYRIFSLLFIHFMWVIFRADDLSMAVTYMTHMFAGAENPVEDARALFLLKDNLAFVAAAVIFCMPVVPWIYNRIQTGAGSETRTGSDKNGRLSQKSGRYEIVACFSQILFAVVSLFLFLWSVSYAVAGANNPFAYANF